MLMVTALLADGAPNGPPALFDTLFPFLAVGIPFIFFITMQSRKVARTQREMLNSVKKNDRVLINGFLVGQVIQVTQPSPSGGEPELQIKIDENANVKMRVLRSSVTRILASDDSAKDTKEGS